MSKINEIISELSFYTRESKSDLFKRLVKERLSKCLRVYTEELDAEVESSLNILYDYKKLKKVLLKVK